MGASPNHGSSQYRSGVTAQGFDGEELMCVLRNESYVIICHTFFYALLKSIQEQNS